VFPRVSEAMKVGEIESWLTECSTEFEARAIIATHQQDSEETQWPQSSNAVQTQSRSNGPMFLARHSSKSTLFNRESAIISTNTTEIGPSRTQSNRFACSAAVGERIQTTGHRTSDNLRVGLSQIGKLFAHNTCTCDLRE
jgi:hypothetical protein